MFVHIYIIKSFESGGVQTRTFNKYLNISTKQILNFPNVGFQDRPTEAEELLELN